MWFRMRHMYCSFQGIFRLKPSEISQISKLEISNNILQNVSRCTHIRCLLRYIRWCKKDGTTFGNVGMTVAWKLRVQKSNIPAILNVYSMHSEWHTAVIKYFQVCLWCQIVIIITVNTILTGVHTPRQLQWLSYSTNRVSSKGDGGSCFNLIETGFL